MRRFTLRKYSNFLLNIFDFIFSILQIDDFNCDFLFRFSIEPSKEFEFVLYPQRRRRRRRKSVGIPSKDLAKRTFPDSLLFFKKLLWVSSLFLRLLFTPLFLSLLLYFLLEQT
jgi:hypothetical protein